MTAAAEPVPIAFCITELDRGGAERALCQLVLGLDRRAWQPRVYCLGPRGHFTDVLEAGGVPVQCLNGHGLLSLPRVLWQLTRALRRSRPVILQTFLFHGNLAGRLAGRLAGVPIVVSGIRVADRRSRWYGRLDHWTNRLVDHNVCVSEGVADFAIQETGLNAAKISVIPNGVNFDAFAQSTPTDLNPFGIRTDAPVVITVGRLEEQKGIEYLLRAAVTVLQSRPDCQFLIVGDGHDRASLHALAATLGIDRRVWFVGSRDDVPGLLRASTVFVLPSLWEGMPNALLEAMAAGVPVIATAVEGSREIVQSEHSGLLVPPADPGELSQAILRLLNDPDLARGFSVAAQLDIQKRFSESSVVLHYDELYRRLLARP
jgi:glycosyltransferase involved in cell wall biosynthesis